MIGLLRTQPSIAHQVHAWLMKRRRPPPPFERKRGNWDGDEHDDHLSPERGGFTLDEDKIFWKSGLGGRGLNEKNQL